MAAVLTGPGIGKDLSCEVGQAEGIIKLPKGEQTGIGGDPLAVELQFEAGIEGDPESNSFCFTRRTVHGPLH
jgi:hypothetical protein